MNQLNLNISAYINIKPGIEHKSKLQRTYILIYLQENVIIQHNIYIYITAKVMRHMVSILTKFRIVFKVVTMIGCGMGLRMVCRCLNYFHNTSNLQEVH